MANHKNVYEGRLPILLCQHHVGNTNDIADMTFNTSLKARLLEAMSFAKVLFGK